MIRLLLQKQSDLGLHCLEHFGRQLVLDILEHRHRDIAIQVRTESFFTNFKCNCLGWL